MSDAGKVAGALPTPASGLVCAEQGRIYERSMAPIAPAGDAMARLEQVDAGAIEGHVSHTATRRRPQPG